MVLATMAQVKSVKSCEVIVMLYIIMYSSTDLAFYQIKGSSVQKNPAKMYVSMLFKDSYLFLY